MTYSNKIYKAMVFGALVLGICLNMPVPANATPPSDIQLSYNMSDQTLTATITHASFMPGIHYIKIVQIKKNGQMISTNTYKNQPDKKLFTYFYKIPASIGEEFEVTASCSIYGSRTAKLSIK
jgi:hypothetical protein